MERCNSCNLGGRRTGEGRLSDLFNVLAFLLRGSSRFARWVLAMVSFVPSLFSRVRSGSFMVARTGIDYPQSRRRARMVRRELGFPAVRSVVRYCSVALLCSFSPGLTNMPSAIASHPERADSGPSLDLGVKLNRPAGRGLENP
jgi:hypothetical protein